MRGHGQSDDRGPDHSWSLDELVSDMRDFMDALGPGQVHYVGESIGGILGVLFATRWPERLKSLTICNSPYRDPSLGHAGSDRARTAT